MANGGVIPGAYEGREQAYVKHVLLEAYLQKLFLIVGGAAPPGKRIELCYVDCFAGPWGDESERIESTSIAISLHTLDIVRQKLGINNVSATVRALYIEKDSRAFGRLQNFLRTDTPKGIHAEAMNGDFVALRDAILRWVGKDAFTFFFIDPKGWKGVEVPTLAPLLARPRSEFLINFMYDFINRMVSMVDWQPDAAELLGEPVSVDGREPREREHEILTAYRTNLKLRVSAARPPYPARTAYVRVLDRAKERPKYHLIYVTSHPRGIIEFMAISEGVELVQRQVRAELQDAERERRTGNMNLFATPVQEEEGRAGAEDVDRFWLDYIGLAERRVDSAAFADILEELGWFPGNLQASLVRLIAAGQVENLDASGKRPKKPLHFGAKGGERLRRTRGRA